MWENICNKLEIRKSSEDAHYNAVEEMQILLKRRLFPFDELGCEFTHKEDLKEDKANEKCDTDMHKSKEIDDKHLENVQEEAINDELKQVESGKEYENNSIDKLSDLNSNSFNFVKVASGSFFTSTPKKHEISGPLSSLGH